VSRAVLITGAGGFVGSHLAEGFLDLGHQVTALDQHFDAPTRARLAGASLVEAPLTRDTLRNLQGSFDLMIHGAAITTPAETLGISELAHLKINLDLLVDALDFAVERSVEAFVFLSSSGVFFGTDLAEVRESTEAQGRGAYALAKRAGELIVDGFGAQEFSTLIVRLGPVYGPHETSRATRKLPSLVRRWLDAVDANQPIFVESPASRRDWTFAPDLARAIDRLVEGRTTGVLHLTSGQVLSDLALAEAIAAMHPGATIETASSPGALRVPMVSERADLSSFSWTPLDVGLAQTQKAAA
jgi:UDP-glucose 4-epimerase